MMLLSRRYQLNLTHVVAEDFSTGAPAELHGHNFKVILVLKGEPNPLTGEIISREKLDAIYKTKIFDPYNYARMNPILPSGTGETIALHFLEILRSSELGDSIQSVQLIETRKNRFQSFVDLTSKT